MFLAAIEEDEMSVVVKVKHGPTAVGVARGTARAANRLVTWTLIVGVLVVVIVFSIVGIGSVVSKTDGGSARVDPATFSALSMGAPASTVRRIWGAPKSISTTSAAGFSETCWMYGVLAARGSYEFCFQHGKLTVKNRF